MLGQISRTVLKIFVQDTSNDDLGLTLTSYGKVKFAFFAFMWENDLI